MPWRVSGIDIKNCNIPQASHRKTIKACNLGLLFFALYPALVMPDDGARTSREDESVCSRQIIIIVSPRKPK